MSKPMVVAFLFSWNVKGFQSLGIEIDLLRKKMVMFKGLLTELLCFIAKSILVEELLIVNEVINYFFFSN